MKKRRLDDRGFSLVELIIVVAIMAVLIGVVGTQVVPYLEHSRKGKDYQIFSGWNTAGMTAYSLNAGALDASKPYTIIINNSAVTCADPTQDASDQLINTFCELTGLPESGSDLILSQMTSRLGKGVGAVKIYIPAGEASGARIITTFYEDSGATVPNTRFETIENQ